MEIERLHELVRKQAIALANLMPARGGSKEELQSQADAIHDHIEVVNSEYENGIREGRKQMREEAAKIAEANLRLYIGGLIRALPDDPPTPDDEEPLELEL